MKPSPKTPIIHLRFGAFTLTELLLAIVIIGVISGISVSSYLNIIRSQAMRSASLATAEWLDNVRKRALQQNQSCEIAISIDGTKLSPGANNQCGDFSGLDLKDIATSGPKATFCYSPSDPLTATVNCATSQSITSESITFSPRGTTLQNGIFAFKVDSTDPKYCTIVLSPLGLIRNGRLETGSCNTRS